jgi:hypothetical protein
MDDEPSKSKKRSDTSKGLPHEDLTFFVDRCLGRRLCQALRAAGFNAEHKDDHFEDSTEDAVWMLEVGERRWVVLTRDTRIRFRPHERETIIKANLRFFSLQTKRGKDGRRGITGEEMAEIILANMEKVVEMALATPAPFIAGIYRSGVRLIHSA